MDTTNSQMEFLGKGALVDTPDSRDYLAGPILASTPPIDWNSPTILPTPPLWNQNASDACVSAAWSYYHWQLKNKVFSKRDCFARIFQRYGAYIRDGGLTLIKIGQQTEIELPDPEFPSMVNMRDRTGLNDVLALDDRELDSFSLMNSIDDCAKSVRDYKGCVFGVVGTNEGWSDQSNPKPPTGAPPIDAGSRPELWGHALYVFGYHSHDGQKCIIARSSWSQIDHHIKENYFKTGYTFNPWTLIPREGETMTNSLVVKNGTEWGIYDPATSEDGLITLMRNRGIVVPLTPEGKLDWTKLNPDKQLV